jgi:glucose/arabinose dehydrogenase
MNHMQLNSRISQVTATAVAAVSLLLLTSVIGGVPPVPLIEKGSVRLQFSTVASGLTAPLEVSSAADGTGRLFIMQQTGQILILEGGVILPTPFLDVADRMVTLTPEYDERGLLGLAFHPDFNDASAPGYHKIYTYTSEPATVRADFTVRNPSPFDHQDVVAEWQVSGTDPNVIDPSTRREVVRIDHPQFNHNGGKLAFRETDRYLYISDGDGGNANDVGDGHNPKRGNAQTKSNVLGKILRIDPLDPALTPDSEDAISANGKYRIPRTNPFIDEPGSVAEIYLYGLRNPYRFSFDATEDQLIIGDVGQNNIEEIDIGISGANYGWNKKEGTFLFNPDDGTIMPDPFPRPGLTEPVAQYSHFDGIAVVAGFTYRGALAPVLTGKFVCGDLFGSTGSARLFYSNLTSGMVQEFRIGGEHNPLLGTFLKGFGQDDAGEIYVLIDPNIGPSGADGQVLKIVGAQTTP